MGEKKKSEAMKFKVPSNPEFYVHDENFPFTELEGK